MLQGDDAVHDAVRIRQLESGVPRRVAAALCNHGTGNDDVLWAALFTLAVLVRDDSVVFARAASALVSAGIFKVRGLWLQGSHECCRLWGQSQALAEGLAVSWAALQPCSPAYLSHGQSVRDKARAWADARCGVVCCAAGA